VKKFALACALLFLGCAEASLRVDLSNTAVELDVFSGRPNPRWQLTAAEASELEGRLRGLPETSQAAIPDNLGYRGFHIEDEIGNDRITITSNGYVVVRRDNRNAFYRDTKGVEEWLLQQARSRGYSELLDRPPRPRKR
jgi:hypothetical protein